MIVHLGLQVVRERVGEVVLPLARIVVLLDRILQLLLLRLGLHFFLCLGVASTSSHLRTHLLHLFLLRLARVLGLGGDDLLVLVGVAHDEQF